MEEFESEEYLVPVIPDDPLLQIDWEEEEKEKNEEWGDTNLKERYKILYMYCTARNFVGNKFCELLNFWFWRVLIWRFCGHVPLRMCMMTQNGRFLFWRIAIKTPNLPNLPYLAPSKFSCCTVYMYMYMYTCSCT